jgi:hypothetical protein
MRPDLSIGVALGPPGGNLWGSGSPGAWHARVVRGQVPQRNLTDQHRDRPEQVDM